MHSNPIVLEDFKLFSYNYFADETWNPPREDISISFKVSGVSFSHQENDIHDEHASEFYNPFNEMNKFALSGNEFRDSGLLPPGFISLDNNTLIFEKPPTHKLVTCYNTYLDQIRDNTPTYTYYLPIPWQLYIVEFNPDSYRTFSVKMFFMQTPVQDFNQQVFLPPIPNFYVNGQLCRPFFSSMDDVEKYPQSLSGIIESAYDWIWSSNFNLDLTETISSVYFQQNPIQLSRNIKDKTYTEYKTTMSAIHDTYSHWESLTLAEVSSFTWPNPAFNQTFNQDTDNVDYTEIFNQWCQNNDIYIEDESDYENYFNSDDFRSTIPNPRFVKKTIKQVIDHASSQASFVIKPNSLESIMISFINSLQTP